MIRSPAWFIQTAAFGAATGSITWQVLRFISRRGFVLAAPTMIFLTAAGFAVGVLLFARVIVPFQERLAARAPGRYPPSLLLVYILVASVWCLGFTGAFSLNDGPEPAAFWRHVVNFLAGAGAVLFFYPFSRRKQSPYKKG